MLYNCVYMYTVIKRMGGRQRKEEIHLPNHFHRPNNVLSVPNVYRKPKAQLCPKALLSLGLSHFHNMARRKQWYVPWRPPLSCWASLFLLGNPCCPIAPGSSHCGKQSDNSLLSGKCKRSYHLIPSPQKFFKKLTRI